MLNKCMIIGHLGRDPEMKYLPNGTANTTFSVASSRRYKSNDQQKEETEWFNGVCWDKLAEVCAQYLQKGRLVYVEGRMQTRSWDDKTSGEKKYRTELIAQEVKFLGGGERAAGDDVPSRQADIDPDDLPF